MNEIIRNLPAVIEQPAALPTTLREALDTAADFAANEKAASTRGRFHRRSSYRRHESRDAGAAHLGNKIQAPNGKHGVAY